MSPVHRPQERKPSVPVSIWVPAKVYVTEGRETRGASNWISRPALSNTAFLGAAMGPPCKGAKFGLPLVPNNATAYPGPLVGTIELPSGPTTLPCTIVGGSCGPVCGCGGGTTGPRVVGCGGAFRVVPPDPPVPPRTAIQPPLVVSDHMPPVPMTSVDPSF